MNTPSSQDKLRKLSIKQKRIIREFLSDQRVLLKIIEDTQQYMRDTGVSEEVIKENTGGSHKCAWHRICTYIHILNGNRGKAIKTFYKWRDNSNDLLWLLMDNHKTGGKKASITSLKHNDKDKTIQRDANEVDEGQITTFATDMKHNDKMFCDILNV